MDDKQALVLTLQAHMLAQQPLQPTCVSLPRAAQAARADAACEKPDGGSTARERALRLEELDASEEDSLASLPDIDLPIASRSMFDASARRGSSELGEQEEHSDEAWGLEGCASAGLRSGISFNAVLRPSPRQDSAGNANNSALASASPLFT